MLFFVPKLEKVPEQCEVTLTLTEVGRVETYCYPGGKTTAGGCPR